MELWIATSNKGKLREFKSLLPESLSSSLKIHSQSELTIYYPPEETGDSFEANARIKAKSLRYMKKNCWVMADDSGLEVEGFKSFSGCSFRSLCGRSGHRYRKSGESFKNGGSSLLNSSPSSTSLRSRRLFTGG